MTQLLAASTLSNYVSNSVHQRSWSRELLLCRTCHFLP